MLYQVHLAWLGFELMTLMVIGTDYIGSCKSNYHMITTTTAPIGLWEFYSVQGKTIKYLHTMFMFNKFIFDNYIITTSCK